MKFKKLMLVGSLLFTIAMININPAISQVPTPDGMTPAEETVCADEDGALKGLCNAFCEAMDCNLNEGIHASPKACERVLANYHSKSGDIDPPCLQSGCAATATAAANDNYAQCITNPLGCVEKKCNLRAREVFRSEYKKCTRDCNNSCSPTYKTCYVTASTNYNICAGNAGDDTNAILLCKTTADSARKLCNTEYTACTTACNDHSGEYTPPTDSCPTVTK